MEQELDRWPPSPATQALSSQVTTAQVGTISTQALFPQAAIGQMETFTWHTNYGFLGNNCQALSFMYNCR
jgi:hypothetical protein